MKVKRDVPVTSMGIRKPAEWGRCIVLERGQVSQRNVIRNRGTAVRNQIRAWVNRMMHVSAT